MRPPRPHLCRTLLREGSAPRSRSARSSSSSLHVLIDSRPGCLPATRCSGDVHHRPIARCCLLLALASCLRSSGDFAHLTVDSSHLYHVSLGTDLATVSPTPTTSPSSRSLDQSCGHLSGGTLDQSLVLRVILRLTCLARRDTLSFRLYRQRARHLLICRASCSWSSSCADWRLVLWWLCQGLQRLFLCCSPL